jgi:hypothetical protein
MAAHADGTPFSFLFFDRPLTITQAHSKQKVFALHSLAGEERAEVSCIR